MCSFVDTVQAKMTKIESIEQTDIGPIINVYYHILLQCLNPQRKITGFNRLWTFCSVIFAEV